MVDALCDEFLLLLLILFLVFKYEFLSLHVCITSSETACPVPRTARVDRTIGWNIQTILLEGGVNAVPPTRLETPSSCSLVTRAVLLKSAKPESELLHMWRCTYSYPVIIS